MGYIKLKKEIVDEFKKNKYTGMVYAYISANRGYSNGYCTLTINNLSLILKNKIQKDKDKGICYNLRMSIRQLKDDNLIKNETDPMLKQLNKNKHEFDYNKLSMWSCNTLMDEDDKYHNSFIMIDYDEFKKLSFKYSPHVLNLYIYIIQHIIRDKEDSCCFTNTLNMCNDLGVCKNTLQKSIDILEKEGLIRVERGDMESSNKYYFTGK